MDNFAGKTAFIFGDSLMADNGSSGSPKSCRALVCAAKGWTESWQFLPGETMGNFFTKIYPVTILQDSNSFGIYGFNDMRAKGLTHIDKFSRMLCSALAWMAIPRSKILLAQSGSVTYSGSWSNTSYYGGTIGKYSAETGASATFSLTGGTIYIDLLQDMNSTRGISISVDGIDKGTYYGYDFVPTDNTRLTYGPSLVRFTGLSETAHTVVLTVTAGSGNAYFNWAASPRGATNLSGPNVYIGGCLLMNSTGYAISNETPLRNKGSDAAVNAYSAAAIDAVKTLTEDGLFIKYIDANKYYNLNTDVNPDNIHPNDSGHTHIAKAFLEAMVPEQFPPRPSRKNGRLK